MENKTAKTADNIFFQPWNTPFGAPPFDKIRESDYLSAFRVALERAQAEIARIRDAATAPTFENTIVPLDEAGHDLDKVSDVFFNLLETDHTEGLERISDEVLPMLTRYENDITLDDRLFSRIRQVYERERAVGVLDGEDWQLLDKTYKAFVRSGALLSEADRAKYRAMTEELADLGQRFGQHVLKDRAAYAYVTADAGEVAGLSQGLLEAARRKAEQQGRDGWLFDLSEPCYFPVMKQAANRALRQRLYEARQRVAFGENDCNNEAVVKRIVVLRAELARLLGYATYADYALENRMAGTPGRVRGFLDDLTRAALPVARREVAVLESFARQDGLEDSMQAWDVAFYAEKWRILHYNIEEEELRHYFPLAAVRGGVFALAERLYGLRFERRTDVPLYRENGVETYAVYDSGRFMGLLYLDYYARPSKQGGAWMTTFRGQARPVGSAEVRPLVQLVFNFEPPRPEGDSLLTFSQLQTFLHEFGHGLHALLSEVRYGGLSGTRVPRDFVELPSQIMENWASEPAFLDLFTRHDTTGEVLPAEMIARLRAAQRFMAGYNTIRQLSFAILDMAWHTLPPDGNLDEILEDKDKAGVSAIDVDAFERRAVAALDLLPPVPHTNMSVQFSHIFSGGYAAGYYGYKWAEVLDADAFECFRENGLFDSATAARFRREILSKGGSCNPMDLYVAFRGREPRQEALLVREGWLPGMVTGHDDDVPAGASPSGCATVPDCPPAVVPHGSAGASGWSLVDALQAAFAATARSNGPEKRRVLQSFFKTGPGEYGAGDAFYGVTVPQTRALAKRYAGDCTEADLGRMLSHPKHEMRLCALLILKMRMQKALKRRDEAGIEACYALYRRYAAGINNWDLVDLSAPDIVGDYVFYKQNTGIFDDLAASSNLWEQRMAVVATYAFIRKFQAEPTFRIVDKLIQHPHDLIHKACGWMLREVGKRVSEDLEYAFLIENDRFKCMPRTMLRYAIERFPETRRAEFLQKKAQKAPGR